MSSSHSSGASSASRNGAAKSKASTAPAKTKSPLARAAVAVKAPAAAASRAVPALPVVPDTHEDDEAVGDDGIDDLDGDEDEDADEDDDDEDAVIMSASAAAAAARTLVDPTASAAAAASKSLRAAARLVRGTKIHFTRAHIRDVVVASAHALGYRRVRPFRGSASAVVPDIVWVALPIAEASPLPVAEVRALAPRQRVNCFPGMKLCATKCEFSRIIKRMQALFPGEFDFVPRTWSLPAENAEFRACARVKRRPLRRARAAAATAAKASSSNSDSDDSNDSAGSDDSGGGGDGESPPPRTYIVKPDAGCGGDGIYLTSKAARIPADAACVVQEYLERPLLLNGLKFDLRVYVLLTSVAPLRYFVCREGLARMAVEPYQRPTAKNMRNTGLHLTNYSLNKMAAEFVPNTEPDDDSASSKRSISTAFRQLREAYGAEFDEGSVWEDISEVVGKTLACIAPILMTVAGRAGGDGNGNADGDSYLPKCFHLLGFDIFLDDAFACHLFEINHHPSLLSEAPVDLFVKRAVLEPLFAMVAFDSAACRRNRARQRRRRAAQRKQRGGDDDDSDSSEQDDDDDDDSASDSDEDPRVAWEVQHAGPAYIACVDAESEFEQFIRPFDALRTIFVQACGIGGEMTSGRFANLVRGSGALQTADADLMFVRNARRWGRRSIVFHDFVDLVLGELGDKICPETEAMTLDRLWAVLDELAPG